MKILPININNTQTNYNFSNKYSNQTKNNTKEQNLVSYSTPSLRAMTLGKVSFGLSDETKLIMAVKNNDLKTVKALLNNNPNINVNAFDESGFPPLHTIFRYPDDESIKDRKKRKGILQELLKNPNIDVNILNSGGESALHLASDKHRKDAEYVYILLKHPNIDVNILTDYGHTPLHYAIIEGNYEIAKALLKHPDINLRILDPQGRDAFKLAEDYEEALIEDLIQARM